MQAAGTARSPRHRWNSEPWRAGAIVALAVVLTLTSLALFHAGIGKNDSLMFRAGATLCGPDLYKYGLERKLLDGHDTPFFRAPFYALALRPLLQLDFPAALFVLNLAAAALVICLLPWSVGIRRYSLLPLAALFIPLAHNFSIEQDGALVLLALSLSLLAESRGYSFVAGAVLALTLEKPTLLLLVPVVVALQRKWRMFWGYLTCALVLGVVSFWIVGISGVQDYIDLVRQYAVVAERMPTARGVAANFHAPLLWPALTIFAVAATAWSSRKSSFQAAFCIGIAGSLFISPQSYAHDCAVLLLPAFYFLANGSLAQRIVSVFWFVPPLALTFGLGPPWVAVEPLLVLLFLMGLTGPSLRAIFPLAGR